ncbi:hypothetical protein [uncultured Victivallis sp.]|uniref:hypothetical protein n=1 Tax=uncultured Victivallis sp. TaxID=354118 RepID=UPI002595AF79|nr:hypothetical protein [uncultured Victivallis sp.]
MKTFRNWTATAMSLTSFLKPGDEVDQEMADYFINAVPPKTMTTDLIQLGEPHDHFRDQDRKYRPVFATLKRQGGKWFYAGICFSGQSEPARHHLFVTQESEVPDFGFKYYRSLCSPKLQYLQDRFGYWHGLDSTGKPDGPLKAGIVVHICNAGGTRISEETTRQWEA